MTVAALEKKENSYDGYDLCASHVLYEILHPLHKFFHRYDLHLAITIILFTKEYMSAR